jgi:hypothetical protein
MRIRAPERVIHTAWGQSDLEHALVTHKIGLCYIKSLERRTKSGKGSIDEMSILTGTAYKNVEILGGSNVPMKGNSVPSYYHELRAGVGEFDEEIVEVLR